MTGVETNMVCGWQEIQVTGIDTNSAMAPYALEAADAAGLPRRNLTLVDGDAQRLPFPDESFDAVVCTLVRRRRLLDLGWHDCRRHSKSHLRQLSHDDSQTDVSAPSSAHQLGAAASLHRISWG